MLKNEVGAWRERYGSDGITKSELARMIGVSRSYITRLEKGQLRPSAEIMFKIARYFGCRVDEVFSYEIDSN